MDEKDNKLSEAERLYDKANEMTRKTPKKTLKVVVFIALLLFVAALISSLGNRIGELIWPTSPLQNSDNQTALTNAQICDQTKTLTDNMETFQNNMTASDTELEQQQEAAFSNAQTDSERQQLWDQQGQTYMQLNSQETYDFQIALLPEAISLRDDLLQRLPTSSVPTTTPNGTPINELIAFRGDLAGVSPVEDVAVYLEVLAHQLCPSQ